MRVSDVRDAERRAEIDIAVVVDVPDVGTARTPPEDRRGSETGDVARFDAREPRRELERARARDARAQLRQAVDVRDHARQCSCKIAP
jgi:hypothetical protein